MKNFKGFDDWIEIFRGGKQTDSNGVQHDGDTLVERAVSSFNKEAHEPPLTLGHPADNSPAYGWVESLQSTIKNGVAVLQAKFGQVVPEFESAVKDGRYKKRSASFYPDGRLRHVGFLGAAMPAVKGLADLKFEERDDAIAFDFYDPSLSTISSIFRNLRDWLIETSGKETADSLIPSWDLEYLKEESNKPKPEIKEENMFTDFKEFLEFFKFWKKLETDPDAKLPDMSGGGKGEKTFTEADLEALKTEAATAERKKVKAGFAEKAAKADRKARGEAISSFCEGRLKDGKLAPAWIDMGLKEFMESLGADTAVEFSDEKKITPYEWFNDFLETLPKLVEFKEIATQDKSLPTGSDEEKQTQLIANFQEKNPKASYKEALLAVSKEHPAVFGK